jgi:hypothetical protein
LRIGPQMLLAHLIVQGDAQARLIRYRDESLVDDRFVDAVRRPSSPTR